MAFPTVDKDSVCSAALESVNTVKELGVTTKTCPGASTFGFVGATMYGFAGVFVALLVPVIVLTCQTAASAV